MRALIGLWILAGLVVSGINGYMLLHLLDEPLAGYSTAAHNASRGFGRYRMLLAAEAQKITSGMDLLANRFTPRVEEEKTPATPNEYARPAAKKVASVPVALPTLTGIITSRSTDGASRRLAVIDGRIWNEGDQLGELTVKGITPTGVRLARGDQTWFLRVPEIVYSLTLQ